MVSKNNRYPYCIMPGQLRHRVTIESASELTTGEPNPTYTTLAASIPAEVIETRGGEYVRGRQIEAGIAAVVTVRYRSDITPDMRLLYGTRYLNIVSVIDPTGFRSVLELACQEVQP